MIIAVFREDYSTDPTGTGCNASFGICLIFGEAPNEPEEKIALASVDGDKLIRQGIYIR